ncbi:ABC transporter ATP-binding protein [Marinilactibacillus psychrotolerans]|uniref:ABC transporter ATP-binding protein n=2 Tax=Marinilactibacillus psychrotolerans TaxID=191770 RepID=A0A511H3P8_9LACT|nr:ABC transporter ATP-binding protein [Marinilactibacillus psychrotolerans]TLQ06482.1 ABC transporter ATP-binding protein [Marinilactibacillus psychrotolerans]SDD39351.1 putative ABC transport system ATP-binding protein [Marinilactibacillus psychrotolerans]SJN44559.1 Macrolide export ATP-binding/permease protein MacB [Marinilactibacillus psychrotolerans 42ea]GEL68143.1 macrolide ABC transporter ATP-binding protein [Marinilactibacillus psychrotolerans]GEQ32818.1 antimicrobial peptide ABC trans
MIEITDIEKIYRMGGETLTALNKVSLSIQEGEFTSIMGPSGSGKSTLMNILGLLDRFDNGQYFLNGTDVSSISDTERAHIRNKEIGFVFQSFNLMSRMNVLENVMLPLVYGKVPRKERKERAIDALEKVGLSDRLNHLTNEISGGQKQRVAIARAIVNRPSVLMADEPTGNLDSKTTEDIMRIFQDLNDEGTTIVMVTHEPEMAEYTKRTIHFRDGALQKDEYLVPKRLSKAEVR